MELLFFEKLIWACIKSIPLSSIYNNFNLFVFYDFKVLFLYYLFIVFFKKYFFKKNILE